MASRQSNPSLGTADFDSSVIEAAWAYHKQVGAGHAKGNVPVEVAAFIAGACWAHMLVAEKEEQLRNQ